MTSGLEATTFLRGPVTGGARGWAFAAFGEDLPQGYIEEEFFLSGVATSYQLTERSADGRFVVEPADTAPFTTRLLVHRPASNEDFNGTVFVEWINVSAGYELFAMSSAIHDGFAYVAVSAQQHGINGYATNPQGLKVWDPERYAALDHPGDAYSYDIFTQAGKTVRELLGDLDVQAVIATGMSQSGTRLNSYLNGVHPIAQVYDGFAPIVYAGMSAPFENNRADDPQVGSAQDAARYIPVLVRADLDVPVFALDTETEAPHHYLNRQSDTDNVVRWEIAGASHASAMGPDSPTVRRMARQQVSKRDYETHAPAPEAIPNRASWAPTEAAMLHHLHRWVREGVRPPAQEPIRFDGSATSIVRDEHGNALGGVRLPDIEVPTGTHTGRGPTGALGGETRPFPAEKLRELYGTSENYVRLVHEAAERAAQQGVILPSAVADYVAAAQKVSLNDQS